MRRALLRGGEEVRGEERCTADPLAPPPSRWSASVQMVRIGSSKRVSHGLRPAKNAVFFSLGVCTHDDCVGALRWRGCAVRRGVVCSGARVDDGD